MTHFDETGFRVHGNGHWLHTACNAQLTYYFVHPNRGQVAMDEMDILPDMTASVSMMGGRVIGTTAPTMRYVMLIICVNCKPLSNTMLNPGHKT